MTSPVKSELGSRPATDSAPAAETVTQLARYDRERDRDRIDIPRSFGLPWLPKQLASLASMELWSCKDSRHLATEDQWRWHTVSNVLAENFSIFDAHLDDIVQGFKSTIWNMRGTCPVHHYEHQHNRYALINTPGFKHTTKVKCFHSGAEYVITKLPF